MAKDQNAPDFSNAVQLFLASYLPFTKSASRNTILSYRDSIKLLLKFVTDVKGMDLKEFTFNDFTKELVNEFLEHYKNNGVALTTLNQRLGSIKSFATYVNSQVAGTMPQLVEILNMPLFEIEERRKIRFLTQEQITKLINKPNSSRRNGLRHKAILMLLYESGCHVQELCDLKMEDVFFMEDEITVQLHGRGNKARSVLISGPSVAVFKAYQDRFHKRSEKTDPFIVSQRRTEIDRDGITYTVQKYATEVAKEDPDFPQKVNCQMLRNSKAIHLLQAGMLLEDLSTFLGLEAVSSAMAYVKAANLTKAEVTKKPLEDEAEQTPPKERGLMDFLNGLK